MDREAIEEAIEVLEDASAEMLMETGDKNYYVEAIAVLHQALETRREWVGLTDEDIHDAFNFTEMVKQLSWDREPEQWCKNFAAYIEAKLKEKNG